MRKTLICWLLGVLSLSSIGGCGSCRQWCEGTCVDQGRRSFGYSPKPCPTCGAMEPAKALPVRTASSESPPPEQMMVAQSAPARKTLPAAPLQIVEKARVNPEVIPTPTSPEFDPVKLAPMPTVVPHDIVIAQETMEKQKEAPAPKSEPAPTSASTSKGITGEVQQFRKSWRLRYASTDQDDPFGGVVVLDGGAILSKLRDGQRVRVNGDLVPPANRISSATFRVQTLEVLD